jgi:F-type H+-transporting ATPase subunit a
MSNPLHQFEIYPVVPLELSGHSIAITNSTIMMFVNIVVLMVSLFLFSRRIEVIPGRMQAIGEMLYGMINSMMLNTAGTEAKRYMPFIFSLFMFVLVCNSMGMIPYSFTVTSHIIVTFAMAAVIFIGVTTIGFIRHGWNYFSLLLPKGTPWVMAPMMIFIEFIAYMVRPISLSARLAANMTAGHIVMKIAASFVLISGLIGVLPFTCLVLLTGFEMFVAVLQAYIFTMLSCIYLSDAIELH